MILEKRKVSDAILKKSDDDACTDEMGVHCCWDDCVMMIVARWNLFGWNPTANDRSD